MKLLTRLTTIALLALALNALAGPPDNATKHMIPFPVICTPTMTEMMGGLTTDYAVHISMTFEETPITGVIIVQNPDTHIAAVLHIAEERTCLIFSGLNMQLFDRPEGMAPPEESVQQDFEDS
tara:strand:+ start:106 stop:474 length:369 start_codon:yes stop_codon:yes gene_type:complete